jgi:chemosensory pili system protein ChpA (sensor histidine kinase/response regulator)
MLGKPECGTITLRMENTETHHNLSVSDDGRGISHARIRERAAESGLFDPAAAERLTDEQLTDLIFARGMSTAQQLNMNAGRGLGMSIVKESVESRAGDMSVSSGPQAGTIITVRIPLPPAPSPIMFLHAADQLFGIPLKFVRHVTEVAAPVLEKSRAASSIQLGSEKYPLCDLNERLNLPRKAGHAPLTVLLIESHGRSFALSVDRISRTEEIMVQPLGRLLDGLDSVCGAALLANGRVAPVLDIEFIGPGHGLAGDAAGKIDPGPALPRVAANLTVLIVDDSLSVRHTTSRVIQSAGWIAVTAKDGVDAIEILRRTADLPAVILSDIEMPRMDGYQFTAALKADDRFKDIPVVMITSRGSEKHRKTAFDLGVSEYMTKPFDDAQLLGTVRELAA